MKRLVRRLSHWAAALGLSVFLRGLRAATERLLPRTAADASATPDQPRLPASVDEAAVTRRIAVLFTLSTIAGLGLLVVYALGGQVQLEGLLLGIAIGGIGVGLALWAKYLFPPDIVTEDRGPHSSPERDVAEAERSFSRGEERIARRTLLVRLLLAAGAALGLAAIFPIRSLGPGPGRALFRTSWRRGSLLVTEAGTPVRVDDLAIGGVITVFPEGHTDAVDAAAVLVRVDPQLLRLAPARRDWAARGNVCYSKICTHAGCPVGLYLAEFHELQCPCHQSAFNVLNGAEPVFGPAPRPLPQLPMFVDDDGYLRARADFAEPVGPGFWNRGAGA